MRRPLVILGLFLNLGGGVTQAASVYTLSTAAKPYDLGVLNQGWWSNFSANNNYNDNYVVSLGWTAASYPYPQGIVNRDFFTFDLSGITGTVQGATLLLQRGNSGSPNPTETLSFWDVTTRATVLNANIGPSAAIVNDLGSGKNYGSFQVGMIGPSDEKLSFELNANAVADLNAALGGRFSLGGSLEGEPAPGVYRYLFGVTQGLPATLQLTVVVPEPGPFGLAAGAGIGWWLVRRRSGCGSRET